MSRAESKQNASDAALLKRLRAGDEVAMARLYDRYGSLVYSVALRILGDASAAEDVLQEVFIQLWRNPGAFDSERGQMAAWLSIVTRNRAIDVLRKRAPDTGLSNIEVSFAAAVDCIAERTAALEEVRRALSDMPPQQRAVLEMAFFEGLTHSEIASRTGEPLGTVKTRIRAGLLALRKAVAE